VFLQIAKKKNNKGKKFKAKETARSPDEAAQDGDAFPSRGSIPPVPEINPSRPCHAPWALHFGALTPPPNEPEPRHPASRCAEGERLSLPTWLLGNLRRLLNSSYGNLGRQRLFGGGGGWVWDPGGMEEQHRFAASLTLTSINGNAYAGQRFRL